jgi:hypothetical protein
VSPAWFGCADQARLRTDPMIGSAPYTRGWLLIEHPGPWPLDAVAGSGIDRAVRDLLTAAARDAVARVLLVRRPGRRAAARHRLWIAVGPAHTVRGHWAADLDLRAAATTVRSLSRESPELRGAREEAILLVCTHGTHDTCCAVRGRPVADALSRTWPEQVWECSHLGGDRFAANVIVLPDGAYYGNLDPDSAVDTVSEHLSGRLSTQRLRGLARYPPPTQVAIAEAHRRLGPLPVEAIDAGPAEQIGHHRWLVPVASSDRSWLATVVAERREPALLTCRALRPTPATAYAVVAFEPVH